MNRSLVLLIVTRLLPSFVLCHIAALCFLVLSFFIAIKPFLLLWVFVSALCFSLPLSFCVTRFSCVRMIVYLMILLFFLLIIAQCTVSALPGVAALCVGLLAMIVWLDASWHRVLSSQYLLYLSLSIIAVVVVVSQQVSGETLLPVLCCVWLGFVLALLCLQTRFLFPVSGLRWRSLAYISSLQGLLLVLFDCYLQPTYPTRRYLYEKRIRDAKNVAIARSAALDGLLLSVADQKTSKLMVLSALKQQCDNLFFLLLESGQLRYRMSDHATFRFCADEMRQLQGHLEGELWLLQQAVLTDTVSMAQNDVVLSQELEGLYESVLQVVAKEPVSFLLFIEATKQLSRCITQARMLYV